MQEIKKRFSEWRQKLTPKKIAIFVLTLLLLITPTVLAGIYAYYVDYVIQADSYTVTLYDAENREIAHDSGDPELANVNSLVRIFHSVTTDMKQVSKAPGDPESDPFIWADVELNGVKSKLKCFFSFVDTANYCIDQSGKIYTVRASDATNFLSSPYAEAFYREAVAPSLITTDNDVILPSSLSWYYKNYDGEYLPSQRNTVNGDMRVYEVAEAIDIRFDKEPDRCLVQIYEEGVSIYDGSLDGLSALTVNVGSELNVSLTATWDTKVSSLSYGQRSNLGQWDMPIPERAGYNFIGWNTKLDGGGIFYTENSAFPTEDTILYSQWEVITLPDINSVQITPNPCNAGQGFIISVGFTE